MKKIYIFFLIACVKPISAQIIETVAGNGNCCGGPDGVDALTTTLYYPNNVAVDAAGNIFVSEANQIRKINTAGIITTMGGSFGGYSGDGGPATSALLESNGVAIDAAGNIYTADAFHCVIRKINTAGIISTFAGVGANGYGGDGGLAINAHFNEPSGLAFDAFGNLYIADSNNHRIRKINTAGIITTVAGNGTDGFSGDGGPATAAKLYEPTGIALDAAGNLYIADDQNNRIRKVNTSGIITTIAGTGGFSFSGDGGSATAAELHQPSDVACDNSGHLFITSDERIRMVNDSGIITTISGSIYGYAGDGGPAIDAQFASPWSIATDIAGNIYVGDMYNHRIRKISTLTGIDAIKNGDNRITVYPNPTNGKLYIKTDAIEKQWAEVFDVNGKIVLNESIGSEAIIDVSFLNAGVYNLTIRSDFKMTSKRIVIVK